MVYCLRKKTRIDELITFFVLQLNIYFVYIVKLIFWIID